jgi:hypothetical protein
MRHQNYERQGINTTCISFQQVVMDSVAFQFRTDFTDFGLRSRILSSMAQQCTQLAIERNIAGRSLSPFHVVRGKETDGVQGGGEI